MRLRKAVLVLVACITACIVGIFFVAPPILGPLLLIFVIGGLVGLFYRGALRQREPPPWRKRGPD